MSRPSPELLDAACYNFTTEIATRYADLDTNRHINNVAMGAIFEEGRARFANALGLPHADPALNRIVVAAYIDYLGEAHHPQPITIKARVTHIGNSSWSLAALALQGNAAKALCRATFACVTYGRPIPMPEAWRAILAANLAPGWAPRDS